MVSYAVIECSDLNPPSNGYITYNPNATSPYDYMTTATYDCLEGFVLSGGDRTRECVRLRQGDEGWSGIAPTCEGEQRYPLNIAFLYQVSFI